jgi:hypothetical protein
MGGLALRNALLTHMQKGVMPSILLDTISRWKRHPFFARARVEVTEADLCESFRKAAEADGWDVYPETGGYDLVLVWASDAPIPRGADTPREGDQVGVEAKLRANAEVLCQAASKSKYKYTRLKGFVTSRGPDFRAVLVPVAGDAFKWVARELGLGIYTSRHCGEYTTRGGYQKARKHVVLPYQRWEPKEKLWLPPVVPRGPGGLQSPSPLTPWRVKALMLCHRLRERGYVTGQDFKELDVSRQIWLERKWLKRAPYVFGERLAKYVEGGGTLPDVGFEAERDEIAALD